ncbi:MAG: hypothetical protein IJO65_08195 [Lachnospiraceae bacterium]|nr:hypothetical protein [Lachnospiraceae bacterium]
MGPILGKNLRIMSKICGYAEAAEGSVNEECPVCFTENADLNVSANPVTLTLHNFSLDGGYYARNENHAIFGSGMYLGTGLVCRCYERKLQAGGSGI